MADPIRIANCSGFFGDRLTAAREMVEGGPIDVLTGDWLAELTMLILARTRMKRPGGGYARTFVTQMEEVMGSCLDKGIKVVSNAGGLDPEHCAEAVAKVADEQGLSPKIAYVRGDDLLPRIKELIAADQLFHFETGEPIKDASAFLTANAYLGCWGIVEALSQRRRHRDHRTHHRCRHRVRPRRLASRLDPQRLRRARRRGRSRPRDRVRHAGHRRQLLVLHRGAGHGARRLPLGRGRGRRLDGVRQARRHRRRGVGRHHHLAAALRDRGARVLRPRRDHALRHHRARAAGRPIACACSGIRGEAPPPTLKVCINKPGGFRRT